MKITAIIPDNLILEVKELSHGKNLTQSIIKALSEWTAAQKIRKMNQAVREKPLVFKDEFSSGQIRELNRIR